MSGDLRAELSTVEQLVRRAVADRRAGDPNPDDPYRGLYIGHDEAARVLDATAEVVPDLESRLGELAGAFRLDPLDVAFLVLAMAPDLDVRFERLYGYLNDDVTRRRASVPFSPLASRMLPNMPGVRK